MHWLRRLRLELARANPTAPRRTVSRGGLTNGQRLTIYVRRGEQLTPAQQRRLRKHLNRARGFQTGEITT